MAKFQLTDDQRKIINQVLDQAEIKGSEAGKIIGLKIALDIRSKVPAEISGELLEFLTAILDGVRVLGRDARKLVDIQDALKKPMEEKPDDGLPSKDGEQGVRGKE